jgi:hypothetical protein
MTFKAASLPVGYIWAPRFDRLEAGRLVHLRGSQIKRKFSQQFLTQFCGISQSRDAVVATVKFARRWGLVGLCTHGLPARHRSGCAPSDRVDGYRTFSLAVDALQRIAMELSQGRPGEDTDWELADSILSGPDFPAWSALQREAFLSSTPLARDHFQTLMRRLVEISGLVPRLNWKDGAWAIDFDCEGSSNLAAILTIQLMARVGGGAMKKCRSCPQWFQPRGRQVYCSACGIRASWRDASARRRKHLTLETSLG